jgi:hypothetical protein
MLKTDTGIPVWETLDEVQEGVEAWHDYQIRIWDFYNGEGLGLTPNCYYFRVTRHTCREAAYISTHLANTLAEQDFPFSGEARRERAATLARAVADPAGIGTNGVNDVLRTDEGLPVWETVEEVTTGVQRWKNYRIDVTAWYKGDDIDLELEDDYFAVADGRNRTAAYIPTSLAYELLEQDFPFMGKVAAYRERVRSEIAELLRSSPSEADSPLQTSNRYA